MGGVWGKLGGDKEKNEIEHTNCCAGCGDDNSNRHNSPARDG